MESDSSFEKNTRPSTHGINTTFFLETIYTIHPFKKI